MIHRCLFLEQRLKNLPDFRTTEAISTFFKGQYSEEDIIKIRNFYFNDHNLECETTRLENIVHVSTIHLSRLFIVVTKSHYFYYTL